MPQNPWALSDELPQVISEMRSEVEKLDFLGGPGKMAWKATVTTIKEAHFSDMHLNSDGRSEYQGALGFNHVSGLVNRILIVIKKYVLEKDEQLTLQVCHQA